MEINICFYNFKLHMPMSMILGKQIKVSSTLAKKEKVKVPLLLVLLSIIGPVKTLES